MMLKSGHNKSIYEAIYDNSSAFVDYLNKLNVAQHATTSGLKVKAKHTLVPHVSLSIALSFVSCLILILNAAYVCSSG